MVHSFAINASVAALLSAGTEQQACVCSPRSSSLRGAQARDGPGRGGVQVVFLALLPTCLTEGMYFILPDCLFDPDWLELSKAKILPAGCELFKRPYSMCWFYLNACIHSIGSVYACFLVSQATVCPALPWLWPGREQSSLSANQWIIFSFLSSALGYFQAAGLARTG